MMDSALMPSPVMPYSLGRAYLPSCLEVGGSLLVGARRLRDAPLAIRLRPISQISSGIRRRLSSASLTDARVQNSDTPCFVHSIHFMLSYRCLVDVKREIGLVDGIAV